MDHLRLILIIIGVSLIASIYLYEVLKRRREAKARASDGARLGVDPAGYSARHAGDDPGDEIDREPDRRGAANEAGLVNLNEFDIDEDFPPEAGDGGHGPAPPTALEDEYDGDGAPVHVARDAPAPVDGMIQVRARPRRGGRARERPQAAPAIATTREAGLDGLRGLAVRRDGPEQLDLSGLELSAPNRAGDAPTPRSGEVRRSAAPPRENGVDEGELVIVVTLMAKGDDRFAGTAVREALEANGLRHGDMDIFHRREVGAEAAEAPLFSAANALSPGTFDLDGMVDLETPGIALFLRLPGPERPGEAFQAMLDTAGRLAERLDGRVCDESRNALTSQSVNHLRERIADFSRRRLLKA